MLITLSSFELNLLNTKEEVNIVELNNIKYYQVADKLYNAKIESHLLELTFPKRDFNIIKFVDDFHHHIKLVKTYFKDSSKKIIKQKYENSVNEELLGFKLEFNVKELIIIGRENDLSVSF